MSNYSLEAVATKVDDMELNPQRNVTVSVENQLTLVDGFGISQALHSNFAGIVAVRFGNQGVSDGSLGPNDRTVVASASTVSIANNTITVDGHGFEEDGIVRIKLPVSGGGTVPGGIEVGVDYYANVVDGNTIKLKTTSGGSVLNLTSTGSGNFLVTRDLFVAYDISPWYTTSSTVYMCTMVNFPFQYGTDAYKWLARYSTTKNVIFCCGLTDADGTSPGQFFYWNRRTERITPALAGGAEWEPFDDVYFYGLLVPRKNTFTTDKGKAQGVSSITANGKTYPSSGVGLGHDIPEELANPGWGNWRNYVFMAHDRCRMLCMMNPAVNGVGFWFRYPNKVKISNIWFDFQMSGSGYVGAMIRSGAQILSTYNVAMYTWSSETNGSSYGTISGDYAILHIMEGAKHFNTGSFLGLAYGRSGGTPYFIGVSDIAISTLSPHGPQYYSFWHVGGQGGIWEYGLTMNNNNIISNGVQFSGFLLNGNKQLQTHDHEYVYTANVVRYTA